MLNTSVAASGLIAGRELMDARLISLAGNRDDRGSFTEVFKSNWGTCVNPAQWSVVNSRVNVFRGMHLHLRHDEYFCLLQGRCLVGLNDLRPGSPTRGECSLFELHGDDLCALTFPRGILHGWYFFEDSVHLQAVSELYEDYKGDDNLGCFWNDPALGIPWPNVAPILSDTAAQFPGLNELKAALRGV